MTGLSEFKESLFERGNTRSGRVMTMHDTLKIGPGLVDCAVNDESSVINTEQAVSDTGVLDGSVGSHFDKTASGYLTVKKAERIDEERFRAIFFVDFGG